MAAAPRRSSAYRREKSLDAFCLRGIAKQSFADMRPKLELGTEQRMRHPNTSLSFRAATHILNKSTVSEV